MIGTDVAQDYLCYVLQTTAVGMLKGQSVALIRDQIRAELFNHFRSAEQRLLTDAGRHASIIAQLAGSLRTALHRNPTAGQDALASDATRAKQAESRADDIVRETRLTVRRIPGTEIFRRILEVADDAADDLEESAFLAGLLLGEASCLELPTPLLGLADLLVDGAHAFQRAIGAAQYVHRGGARENMQQFLAAIDHVVTIEHQTDERERAVTVALVHSDRDWRQLHLISGIAGHLESAADALLRASLMLRDWARLCFSSGAGAVPRSFIRSSQLRRRASFAACAIPSNVCRTGHLHLTQPQIGDHLGLTNAHVNRVLRWLSREDIALVKGYVVIIRDVPRIRRLARGEEEMTMQRTKQPSDQLESVS